MPTPTYTPCIASNSGHCFCFSPNQCCFCQASQASVRINPYAAAAAEAYEATLERSYRNLTEQTTTTTTTMRWNQSLNISEYFNSEEAMIPNLVCEDDGSDELQG